VCVIVCHCKEISDREIRAVIRGGARSCQQVGRACEAGRLCGTCEPLIRELIEHESPGSRTPTSRSGLLALLGFLAAD
jgi:bacterioferritin-associated ferredoxin